MDLDSLKYAELRSVAKQLGLKANMKADKLLKAIKQHYEREKNEKEETQGRENYVTEGHDDAEATREVDAREDDDDASRKNDSSDVAAFVSTRRGRRNRTKRKVSDVTAVTAGDADPRPSAAEGDTEVAVSGAPSGAGRAKKKRRVSSTKGSENVESEATGVEEQRSDAKDEAPVQEKVAGVAKGGKIPRYQGLQQQQKKNRPSLKPVTPNFKKLHEAHFKKLESIDSYVQRKTKQLETYRNSVKDLKQLSDKIKARECDGKTQVKVTRASMFSPVPAPKRAAEGKCRHTLLPVSKAPPGTSARKEEAKFRPSVLSTRRINVRFSEATHDKEHKRAAVKTPARRSSPCVTSSTPLKQTADGGKPNHVKALTASATKTPGTFVFTGNTSTSVTPGTQKSKFDLKASLSRPLTYRPHTGKLKPFGETNENTAANKSLNSVSSHQENYKKHQVQTRADRRTKLTEDRKQKKENMLGARRGLVML